MADILRHIQMGGFSWRSLKTFGQEPSYKSKALVANLPCGDRPQVHCRFWTHFVPMEGQIFAAEVLLEKISGKISIRHYNNGKIK